MSGITVEVVFALPERQTLRRLRLAEGSTVQDALSASGLAQTGRVGIHGRVVSPATILRDGDRVEIYRPLRADPKELRRARAAKKPASR